MKTRNFQFTIKTFLFLLFVLAFLTAKSQNEPAWLKDSWRTDQYPANVYITGFVQDEKNKNESTAEATERVKNMARSNLSESILASVQSVSDSYSQSILEKGKETVNEKFTSDIKVSTNLELNGVRIESFVKDNMIYGFAYANKYEIIGYYKANLNMQIQQIEGIINTANELESNREKIKAKNEFNKTLPIFNEITKSQGILTAIDKNITDEDLKMQNTMKLYNDVAQANIRLAQGVLVYIVTNENLFGEVTNTIDNNLKAILAENGCSFTTIEENADWKIMVTATSREYNHTDDIYFSYTDAEVKLFKAPSDKHVYQNVFSQKGAHGKSYSAAAKKGYDDISKQISEKILVWINN
ncbi:MAG: hypothetical protein AB7S50_08300 [Bacteroidales bacterium]